MIPANFPTSLVEFKASPHGSKRRDERGLLPRDLQVALKYGKGEKQFCRKQGPLYGTLRYKFTFNDVVYITDETCTREITSYEVPPELKEAHVLGGELDEHKWWKGKLQANPGLISSHIVHVIDHSASMRTPDVPGQPSRLRAVYYSLACDFMAKRLRAQGQTAASTRDVISLIAMHDEPKLILSYEPMTWVLHNKLVGLANTPKKELAYSHGNYVPALRMARQQLRSREYEKHNRTLGLIFLSDGQPSDVGRLPQYRNPWGQAHMRSDIWKMTTKLVPSQHCQRLVVNTLGFGKSRNDFSTLREMADAAKEVGIKSDFILRHLSMEALGTGVSSFLTDFMQTHTTLQIGRKLTLRSGITIAARADVSKYPDDWDQFGRPEDGQHVKRWTRWYDERGGHWQEELLVADGAVGFAKRKDALGKGAERVVFEACEINEAGHLVDEKLVAKESIYTEDLKTEKQFYIAFLLTQHKARNLAVKFNKKLDDVLDKRADKDKVARVDFLQCSVYEFEQGGDFKAYLLEKRIDHKAYQKWNDNKGSVRDQSTAAELTCNKLDDLDDTMGNPGALDNLDIILEEDSQYDSDGDGQAAAPCVEDPIRDDDVLQAFTHWTYCVTKRSRMVCDLQGVLNKSRCPPHFEFTDPCIHSEIQGHGRQTFGRTDRGIRGMHDFIKTHKCNALCKLLGIETRREDRDWSK